MNPTRRTILLAGVISLTGIASGGITLALRGTHRHPDVPPLQIFTPDEYSVVAAIADTFHPGTDALPTGTAAGVPLALDAIAAAMHVADREELRQAIGLIENALVGAVLQGRTTTFTGSSPEVRYAALRGWQTSGISLRRQAFKALKGLCAGAYWSNPACGQFAGYAGPPNYGQAHASKPTRFASPQPDPLGAAPDTAEDLP